MPEVNELSIDFPAGKEVAIAAAIVPYPRDDERAVYLGYRACGLSSAESLTMMYRSKEWLETCRDDVTFVELESRIPEYRKELAREYIQIEWMRNFRLVLEKDKRVLLASLSGKMMRVTLLDGTETEVPEPMTRQDFDYLLKLRSQYTPQQLQAIETVLADKNSGFDFSKWASQNQSDIQNSRVTLSRTEQVTIEPIVESGQDED